ncbi:MAG: RimK family alpha-L-glutamate ligase [Saprospiraceae bacterium]
MDIAILSRGPQLYSTQSLYRAGRARGHNMYVIDHTLCNLVIEAGQPQIYYEGRPIRTFDAVIPRIGASVTEQGAAVISQFELMNVFTAVRSNALRLSRDKLRCLQELLRQNLDTPKTAALGLNMNLWPAINAIGGFPVVIKLLEGTHGIGVILCETIQQAESTVEAFQRLKERVILQEFIHEAEGADIRAFIVAGEVVAVMKRQAKEGEFRSNLHRGASAVTDHLTPIETNIVCRAAKAMGLSVAGVDLLRSNRGPLIMEVNASPGLEGIETVTGINVAAKIMALIEQKVKERKRAQARLR